ncbi:MAG: thioredoxin family protein [Rhodothermales bacterium]
MAATESLMQALGGEAPAFDLITSNPWADQLTKNTRAFEDYPDAKVFVVIFTCNHCPYAIHVEQTVVDVANEYAGKGVQFIAISSNDATKYPADSFEKMSERARALNFPFPYLYDETQQIARAYGAVCTPDIFVYDHARILKYRGRFDETRPGMGTAHGGELKAAMDQVLESGDGPEKQYPSIGCSIKWLPENTAG